MENENNVSSEEMEEVKRQFANYNKKDKAKRKSSEEILKKYFVPRNTKETFRALPVPAGKNAIIEAFFHVVPTNQTGGKLKEASVIYCPSHNDPKVQKLDSKGEPAFDMQGKAIMVPAPCPLCARHKELIAKQDPSIKYIKKDAMTDAQKKIKEKNDKIYKDAVGWEAKKFYILKGVDKGQEKDGVKFWRFKHNFKNNGTLDKLRPVLEDYMELYKNIYYDKNKGCDLSITMADTEQLLGGKMVTYKQITAIAARPPSILHTDPIVMDQWLNDDITWRDVFLPKKAPNITPYQYLEMILNHETPYWDDTDDKNKHWVFPNHPDLEILANTRTQNLEADDEYEQASDLDDMVTISNVQPSNITHKDNAINLGDVVLESENIVEDSAPEVKTPTKKTSKQVEPPEPPVAKSTKYDDLPF